VALVNRDPTEMHRVSLNFGSDNTDSDFFSGPASTKATVRDVGHLKDLGTFDSVFNATLPPMDGLLLRFTFVGAAERQKL